MHRSKGKHRPLPHHPRPLVRDLGAIVKERKTFWDKVKRAFTG